MTALEYLYTRAQGGWGLRDGHEPVPDSVLSGQLMEHMAEKDWIPIGRWGATGISIELTPVGRQLSSLVKRFHLSNGFGWLPDGSVSTTPNRVGQSMVLADLIYWAAESGVFAP